MKHYRLIILGLIITSSINAQSFSEKVAIKACVCLDSLESFKQLEDSLRNCTSNAMALVMIESSPEEKKILNTVQGITGVFQEVNEILPSYCYNVRRLMIVEKKKQFYDLSSIPVANEHYLKGNEFMDNGDYAKSISEFQKAIKIDNRFVYAYDHLAISYRRQENYKKAIKYYKKSLEIFPEGDVALLNIAVSYSFLKDYENCLKFYNELIFLYQDNPEGYFGAGKIQYVLSDYENALENVFNAHRMYIDTNSDYIQDSEKLISIMYSDLKEKGKIDLFLEKAEKYNITIDE